MIFLVVVTVMSSAKIHLMCKNPHKDVSDTAINTDVWFSAVYATIQWNIHLQQRHLKFNLLVFSPIIYSITEVLDVMFPMESGKSAFTCHPKCIIHHLSFIKCDYSRE